MFGTIGRSKLARVARYIVFPFPLVEITNLCMLDSIFSLIYLKTTFEQLLQQTVVK